ncbi:sigma-70 family RNA polymerase sigma factor [Hydrocarboniphaga effusa]|jgi:RNA polymerase sigma-70 factor (ECF subfamily)|uniref:sigma-70 family RNA polymerase sigma factor n=1 Tax=Hydrocarboniphaga effusa TaxID=243629 RepID=UPI0035B39877
MLRYREGDVAAFRLLYGRHRGGVYRYLLRGCDQEDQAAELFQDVWANVVRSRERYEAKARFATWLYTLAHHRLIDHVRARKPATEALDDDTPVAAPSQQQPDAQAEAASQRVRLLQELSRLPLEQRQAFLMKEEGGLSLEEIAQATGVGRETVKSRLRYALARLREALTDVL